VLIVIFAKVGTLVVTLQISIVTTERILWITKAMPYFRETLISFFLVCGFNKLNKVDEGDLVYADVPKGHCICPVYSGI
jgi:hypothetical protein